MTHLCIKYDNNENSYSYIVTLNIQAVFVSASYDRFSSFFFVHCYL